MDNGFAVSEPGSAQDHLQNNSSPVPGFVPLPSNHNRLLLQSLPTAAKTELQDEDWKTAIAQKKPTIPAGAVVKITGTLQNMYGDFVKVEYNGVKYTVEPRKLDIPKTLEEQKQAIRKAALAAGAKIIENN